jgi:hypothetical protein
MRLDKLSCLLPSTRLVVETFHGLAERSDLVIRWLTGMQEFAWPHSGRLTDGIDR